ncbi:hypothetical protein BDV28DRAFT_129365 [Aspergillus coremiiformis]|uniref:BZIP domain-containing protein n=1 Tax=Aspergillus coremiiformis TaxID=138285 RepID=A0A5N6ZEM8_9EURO|nr:hypothetical protein BDV28DRAFT_129365 [Aspergillus coremiiformis]
MEIRPTLNHVSLVHSQDQETTGAGTFKIPSRKRERPREIIETCGGKGRKERRREQIREAQQTYWSRKEADTMTLNKRITQLETAAGKVSETVATLSDILLQSGVLAAHPELTEQLHETIQICRASVTDVGDDHGQAIIKDPQEGEEDQ